MIYDTLNPRIVSFILENAKQGIKVLDVGCGTGRLAKELKNKLSCFLEGIEIDKDAVYIANKAYDKVNIIDLEKLINKSQEFNSYTKFNYIIFGDILEHTTKPEILLRYFRHFLEEEGFIIASIPNVANWMIRLHLLFGNFNYLEGILDPGHLKFFTYKTARKLLEENGYKIVSVLNNNQTWLFRFLGRYWKSMFAFQFVFKCCINKEWKE